MYVYDHQSLPTEVSNHFQSGIGDLMVETFQRFPDVRSGVLTQVAMSVTNLPLGRYPDADQITEHLTRRQDLNLPLMLVEVRTKSFRVSDGDRVAARNVSVVFIHEELQSYTQLDFEAKRLKFKDRVEVYVVYVGKTVPHHVRQIASESNNDHVIHVTSYTDTELWTSAVLSKLC